MPKGSSTGKWIGTNIRKELARRIAKLAPHWNVNEFVDVAVREKLEKIEQNRNKR